MCGPLSVQVFRISDPVVGTIINSNERLGHKKCMLIVFALLLEDKETPLECGVKSGNSQH